MNKVSLIATTVITGAVLFTTANVSEAKADEVTANNAKDVAQQAMKNSGGNPNLQNFNAVKIKGTTTKSVLIINLVQVWALIKFIKMVRFNIKVETLVIIALLNSEDCYTGQDITTKPYKEPKHVAKKK